MLFNSFEFIFVFLPVTLTVFWFLTGRGMNRPALYWLVICALVFYARWNAGYALLLLGSVFCNFMIGEFIGSQRGAAGNKRRVWGVFTAGVVLNIGLIAYYKYAGFFAFNVNTLFHTQWPVLQLVLPLGISFFTFQQLAYIIDIYRGAKPEKDVFKYLLFVVFFPHLIAGPILHPNQIIPQFNRALLKPFQSRNFTIGAAIFILGLFKKVIFADGIAGYATPVFDAAARGEHLTFLEAWSGALAYTFQLYFDFSGYSDMATGLARMFGIRFPLNFFSPYKAGSIIDFWRRWHMTLSRFLRDYVYIPLGGNRKGPARRYVNLMLTMLIGGLWHGAAWTFVMWGALHGALLTLNHLWRDALKRFGCAKFFQAGIWPWVCHVLTFVCVIAAWVIFRSQDPAAAGRMFAAMTDWSNIILPFTLQKYVQSVPGLYGALTGAGFTFGDLPYFKNQVQGLALAALFVIIMVAPNTAQIMQRYAPVLKQDVMPDADRAPKWMRWRPTTAWACVMGLIFVYSILSLSRTTEFLYFNF